MGPLRGLRVLEIASIGPGPFCAMLLADMGADVLRMDRADIVREQTEPARAISRYDLVNRGRRSLAVDLKHPDSAALVLRLVERADAFVEGFRPGVCERLGIGPAECLDRNPRLVYGRATGWGQEGPLAALAGHDINYIALAGALHPIGRAGQPSVPPLNLVGDYGGGGMLLAMGVLAALLERKTSDLGQVVDAAMVDGAALLTTMFHGLRARGEWTTERGTNLLDGAAPFYDVYETSDGLYVSVGSLEPRFYEQLIDTLGLTDVSLIHQMDRTHWPELKQRLAAVFRTRTRDEWTKIFAGSDACFAPVLSLDEAAGHAHNRARHTFVESSGLTQPAPAPRFSRTTSEIAGPPPVPGEHTHEALLDWGLSRDEVAHLFAAGVVA